MRPIVSSSLVLFFDRMVANCRIIFFRILSSVLFFVKEYLRLGVESAIMWPMNGGDGMEFQQEAERFKRLRRRLHRQIQWSRNVFLLILAVSAVNLVLLFMGLDYHFLFSAAVPYYMNWLAAQLGRSGLKVLAVAVTVLVFALGGGCWYFFRSRRWLEGALVFYAVDTVALAVMALTLLENPLSCLLEVLVHGLGLLLLFPARKAATGLEYLKQRMEERKV